MSKLWINYFWKDGRPQGYRPYTENLGGVCYKIVADPYFKHISVEQFENGRFTSTIYDSRLLNFRHLKPEFQTAWQKEPIDDYSAWIRNEHDHTIYKEVYSFKDDLCVASELYSCHGIHLASNKLFYKTLGDTFNGILLSDKTGRPVWRKEYTFDEQQNQFTGIEASCMEFSPKDGNLNEIKR